MAPNVIQVLSFGRCGNCQLVKICAAFSYTEFSHVLISQSGQQGPPLVAASAN